MEETAIEDARGEEAEDKMLAEARIRFRPSLRTMPRKLRSIPMDAGSENLLTRKGLCSNARITIVMEVNVLAEAAEGNERLPLVDKI